MAFIDIEKLIVNFIWKGPGPGIAKITLKKRVRTLLYLILSLTTLLQ